MVIKTEWDGIGKKGRRLLQYKLTPVILFISLTVPGIFAGSTALSSPPQSSRQYALEEEQDEGFQFSAPRGFIGFRIGRFFPEAKGELFDFVTEELTLERNDFRAWNLAFEGGFGITNRVDIVFGFEYMKRSKHSEFRDWVDENELPIVQETSYSQIPITAGAKILLIPRGRQVGRYTWVPSDFVPYIGGGIGVLRYRFGQVGDFVDFETLEIFSANLESSGWTPTGYLGGGIDIRVAHNTYVTLDVRYSWAKPELGEDYVSFEPMNLSGIKATAGLQWHF